MALNNDYQQFKVFLEPMLEGRIVDRHESNEALFQAFFDMPEFRSLMQTWLTKKLYAGIRDEHRSA